MLLILTDSFVLSYPICTPVACLSHDELLIDSTLGKTHSCSNSQTVVGLVSPCVGGSKEPHEV